MVPEIPNTHTRPTPFWWDDAAPTAMDAAPVPAEADVAVIGGGYAGVAAAIELADAGRSVAVFEKGKFGEGASTRNGGITSGSIRPSHDALVRRFGETRAFGILHEGKAAREDLWAYLAAEKIDCDFHLSGVFEGAMTPSEAEKLARKADFLARNLGIEARPVAARDVPDYIGTELYTGGYTRPDIGGLDPAKLFRGMLQHAGRLGAGLYDGTAVLDIARERGGFRLTHGRGSLRAGALIQCTNGYTDGVDPWLRRRLVPVRSRIIATEPLPPEAMTRLMPARMMYGDVRQLSYYYRPSPDGCRILFGGRDGTITGDPLAPTLHLRRELARIFPDLANIGISHSWFGNVAMNQHMIPRLIRRDGRIYATGFCGSGVVWARWLGRKAALAVLGHPDAATAFELEAPPAVPLYRGKPWFIPAVIAWYAWQDRRVLKTLPRPGRS
jgi:glycine/D-amino acid oxidase-like deaminating enzyme